MAFVFGGCEGCVRRIDGGIDSINCMLPAMGWVVVNISSEAGWEEKRQDDR